MPADPSDTRLHALQNELQELRARNTTLEAERIKACSERDSVSDQLQAALRQMALLQADQADVSFADSTRRRADTVISIRGRGEVPSFLAELSTSIDESEYYSVMNQTVKTLAGKAIEDELPDSIQDINTLKVRSCDWHHV